MRTKHPPQIAPDLMVDIIRAQKLVKKTLKDKTLSYQFMSGLIRSWQGELGQLRRKFNQNRLSARELRGAELSLAFLKEVHNEHSSKYESYWQQGNNGQNV